MRTPIVIVRIGLWLTRERPKTFQSGCDDAGASHRLAGTRGRVCEGPFAVGAGSEVRMADALGDRTEVRRAGREQKPVRTKYRRPVGLTREEQPGGEARSSSATESDARCRAHHFGHRYLLRYTLPSRCLGECVDSSSSALSCLVPRKWHWLDAERTAPLSNPILTTPIHRRYSHLLT